MATYLNPALIADSVPEPQPVPGPIAMAEGVGRVRQLQQQNQQQAGLYPIAQEQAQVNLQGTQLDVQQKQQHIQDQAAFGAAVRDSGGDPDKLESAANEITDPLLQYRIKDMASQSRLRLAQMTAAQNNTVAELHGQLADRIGAVLDAKDTATKSALTKQLINDAASMKDPVSGKPLLPPGTIDPNVAPTDQGLQDIQQWLKASANNNLNQAKLKEQLATAAKNQQVAKTSQANEERSEIANMYQGVQTPEDHAKFLQDIKQKFPDRYQEYAGLKYDPESTPDTVETMALSPKERSQDRYRTTMAQAASDKAKVYGGRAGLAARAADLTLPDDQRAAYQKELESYDKATGGLTSNAQLLQQRYLQKRQDTDQKLHSTIEQQKQAEQGLANRYGAILQKAGVAEDAKDPDLLNQTVKDPKTGRDITAAEALAALQASRGKITGFIGQQDQIEKRQQWGKYAPTPTTPPPVTAAPATATPAPASRAVPAGQPAPAAGGSAKTTKTFPRARLESYAKASNSTPEQAETYLKSKGYVIQ